MKIPNFSKYEYDGEVVTNLKTGKTVTKIKTPATVHDYGRYMLKNDKGKWKTTSRSKIDYLTNQNMLILPEDAKPIPWSDGSTYITPSGEIYTYSSLNPTGIQLNHINVIDSYPSVGIIYKGSPTKVKIHKLVLETFVDSDYRSKGLVCLHKDNNKKNYDLSNLCVGTSSENNLAAYRDGVNRGNKLKQKWVRYQCPVCDIEFERRRSSSHFVRKRKNSIACSQKCSGKLRVMTIPNKIIFIEEFEKLRESRL